MVEMQAAIEKLHADLVGVKANPITVALPTNPLASDIINAPVQKKIAQKPVPIHIFFGEVDPVCIGEIHGLYDFFGGVKCHSVPSIPHQAQGSGSQMVHGHADMIHSVLHTVEPEFLSSFLCSGSPVDTQEAGGEFSIGRRRV